MKWPYDPKAFDGAAFKKRYGYTDDDFWAEDGHIYLREGLTCPDDPPIFDAPVPRDPELDIKLSEFMADIEALPEVPGLKKILKRMVKRIAR